jgi:hypothetical protein
MSLFPIISPVVKKPAAATFVATYSTGTNASSFTKSGASIGTASSDRKVVVCAFANGGGSSRPISSVTIDGNTMTQVVLATLDGENHMGIYEYELSSGTTATIVITCTGVKGEFGMAIFAVTNAALTVNDTASTSADLTPNTTIDCSENGIIIGGCNGNSGSNATSAAWTNLTEKSDVVPDPGSNVVHTSACDDFDTTQTGRAISVAFNVGVGEATMCIASWDQA